MIDKERLAKEYVWVHENTTTMSGRTTVRNKDIIKEVIDRINPVNVLDFGCGKGWQYTRQNVHEYWGIPMPTLYDPAIAEFSKLPQGTFDSVICTDVMEHIHQDECDKVLEEIFAYADHSVFFTISCNPAKKSFPDGTNYHVNCKPEEWWFATIKRLKPKHLKVWLIFSSWKGIIKYDKEETR